ncbi:hypothetical protein [Rubrimonas cliftonensis]|uniref:Bacteriophage replication gene A protein (GPA) n=1 Tax=Rubrimonas cliftonensis TaxID=89524 RepID=A0A1H4FYZ5_9RHOB|nr:hypothetical protein [Rubrimonas cliftonensis]SEB02327.1 hypothetical protein SAMN05444370_13123 [Rubrimonas cliftonensis]
MHRPTSFIKRKAGASLLHSARTAAAIGRPLNTHVTLSFWLMDIGHDAASTAFQALRERHFQRWSRYTPRGQNGASNGPPTYAWVVEAPYGHAHVHWMVHISPGNQERFVAALQKWVAQRITAALIPATAIDVQPITHAEGLKLYLAKGLDPHLARLWRIRPEDAGLVIGRRCGTSRNLGPAEWRPRKAAYLSGRRRAA